MSRPAILVTGATGHVGSEILRQVPSEAFDVRGAVRPTEHGSAHLPDGVTPVAFDYDDTDAVARAFDGVERLYMMAPVETRFTERMAAMLAAAKTAGIGRIVHQSQFAAEARPGMVGTIWHSEAAARTRAAGVAYAILQPNAFMQNVITRYAPDIRRRNAIVAPAGDSRVSFIDPADIGACAVALLTREHHEDGDFPVTGPQSLSFADLAATLSQVLGRTIRYVDQSDDAFRADATAAGMDETSIKLTLEGYRVEKLGHYEAVTQTVTQLLGRPARSFHDWAQAHAAAFASETEQEAR